MASTTALATHLAALADARLVELLEARPDLVSPPASSLSALAARAGGRMSVEMALSQLDGTALAVAAQLVADPGGADLAARLASHLGLEVEVVTSTLAGLERLVLLVDGAPVPGLVEVLGAPGEAAAYPVAPPSLKELDRLSPEMVAAESCRHAEEAVRLVGALLAQWGSEGGPVLRGGGVGVRALSRTTQELGTTPAVSATVIELAGATGLLGLDDQGESWVPSAAAQHWLGDTLPQRWAVLAWAWATSNRTPWLVGSRGDAGSLRPVLHDEVEAAWAGVLRRRLLGLLAGLPQGAAPSPAWVREALTFARPRRPAPVGAVSAVLAEAELLGVTGAGVLSGAGRALAQVVQARQDLGQEPADAELVALEEALATDLPTPVDVLLVQSDLTAVVPGRPTPALAGLLELATVVESRGAAVSARLTPESVRAALDAGHTGASLLEALGAFSPTPLPGALVALVEDAERHHGAVRVRPLGCVLRVGDPAVAAGLLSDPRLGQLGLDELAPGLLAASTPAGQVLRGLRGAGLAPVLEDASGRVVLAGAGGGGRRQRHAPASTRPGAGPVSCRRAAGPKTLARLVARLREGERSLVSSGADPAQASDPVHVLAVLRQALSSHEPVRLMFTDPSGQRQERRARVLSLEAGRVRLADLARETELTVAVHRIVSVAAG